MLVRLSSSVARGAILFAVFLLGVALSYYSIRNARAEYQAGLGALQGYQRATQLEPVTRPVPKSGLARVRMRKRSLTRPAGRYNRI